MKRLLAMVMLALSAPLVLSCATGKSFTEIQPNLAADNQQMGRIFFYRPSSFGAALRPDILLNGERVGEAVSWGFFYVDRPAGNYEAVTSTEVTRKVSFILEPGQTRYIRLSSSLGFFVGHIYGELVDDNLGISEIRDCKYIGAGSQ